MRPEPFIELLAELDQLDGGETFKGEMRKRIFKVASMYRVPALLRIERIEFASRLLNCNVSVPTVRDRLKARFDISKTQAYRDIEEALQLSHKQHLIGTPNGSNRNDGQQL